MKIYFLYSKQVRGIYRYTGIMNWIPSFLTCSFANQVLKYSGSTQRMSSSLVSTIFQMNFLYKTSSLIYNEITTGTFDITSLNLNLQELYGYFIYDIVEMVVADDLPRNKMYLIHHTISCLGIDTFSKVQLTHGLYLNLFCFFAELPSPLLNMRIFFKNGPYRDLMKNVYFISRVVVFPLVGILVLKDIPMNSYEFALLSFGIGSVYATTLFWFSKLLN